MTSDEKLQFVQSQFDEIWTEGKEKAIDCPWCYAHVEPGQPVCCMTMHRATVALIERAQIVEQGLKQFESRSFRREIMSGLN